MANSKPPFAQLPGQSVLNPAQQNQLIRSFQNKSGQGTTTVRWQDIQNKPSEFPIGSHSHNESDIANLSADLSALKNQTPRPIVLYSPDSTLPMAQVLTAGVYTTVVSVPRGGTDTAGAPFDQLIFDLNLPAGSDTNTLRFSGAALSVSTNLLNNGSQVAIGGVINPSTRLAVNPQAVSEGGVTVSAFPAQTAPLIDCLDPAGTTHLFSVLATGAVVASSSLNAPAVIATSGFQAGDSPGLSATISLAKITATGTAGTAVFTGGLLTAYTAPT